MTSALQIPKLLVLDANFFKTLKQTRNLHAMKIISKISKDLEIQLVTSPLVFGEIVTGGKNLAVPRGFLSVHVGKQEVNKRSPLARDIHKQALRTGMLPKAEADFELFVLSKELAQQQGRVGLVTNDEGIHTLVQCCTDFPGEVSVIEPVQMLGHYIRFCEKAEEEEILIRATRDSTEYFIKYRLNQRRDFSTLISALIENMRSGISIQVPIGSALNQSQRVIFAKAIQGLRLSSDEVRALSPFEGIVNSIKIAMESETIQEREYWIGRSSTEFILATKEMPVHDILPLQCEIQTYLLSLHLTQFREYFEIGDAKAAINQLDMASIGASLLIGEGGEEAVGMLKLLKAILLMALKKYDYVEALLQECELLKCALQEVIPLVQYIASLTSTREDIEEIQPPIGEGWEQLVQIAEDLQYLGNKRLAGKLYASILIYFPLSSKEKRTLASNLLLCERTESLEETRYLDLLTQFLSSSELKDLTRSKLDSTFKVTRPTRIAEIPSIWLEKLYTIDAQVTKDKQILIRAWHPKLRSRIGIEINQPHDKDILFSKTLKISKGVLNRINVDPRRIKRLNVRAIIELAPNVEFIASYKKWWITSLEK